MDNNFNKKKFICEKCNFNGIGPTDLLRHFKSKKHNRGGLKIHEVDYKCEDCSYETNNPVYMKKHKISMHATPEEKKSKCYKYCDDCNVGFFSQSSYIKHLNTNLHKNIVEIKRIQELEKENRNNT